MTSHRSLAEVAELARRLAPGHCSQDAGDGAGCDWYHAAWPTLRLSGTVSGIDGDADFFRSAFSDAARDGDRVLVTAAADHAMLEHVLAAYRGADAEPRVTVVDRCETPLLLNRHHADASGAAIECVRDDILTYRPDRLFDLVCTHSILSFIPAGQRDGLFANWRAMLRSGGRLVVSQAVRPAHPGAGARRFSPEEVDAFVQRALGDAAVARIQMDPSGLAGLARRFASHKTAQVVDSVDAIRSGLERAGFGIERCEAMARGARYASASPDPSAIVNARFVAIAR